MVKQARLSVFAGFVNRIKAQSRQAPGKHQRKEPRDGAIQAAQHGVEQVEAVEMLYLHVQMTDGHHQEAPGEQVHPFAEAAALQGAGSGKGKKDGYEKKRKLHDAKPIAEARGRHSHGGGIALQQVASGLSIAGAAYKQAGQHEEKGEGSNFFHGNWI